MTPVSFSIFRTCRPRQQAWIRSSFPPTAKLEVAESTHSANASSGPTHMSCRTTLRTAPPRLCAALPPPRTMMRWPSLRSRASMPSSVLTSRPLTKHCMRLFAASTATVKTCHCPTRIRSPLSFFSAASPSAPFSPASPSFFSSSLATPEASFFSFRPDPSLRSATLFRRLAMAAATLSEVPTEPVSPTYTDARCKRRELPERSFGLKRRSAAC
mmetsp:Transcript_29405/g.70642  ORF Transcript_29405/g.70642 Transcript_29405/m.70642 type:complete len:214 (+) Transcript_29405:405-1046(+)